MLKTKEVVIESGRDADKRFLVTEMPLLKADKWAQRALFALASGGVDAGTLDLSGGMLEMAKFAFAAIGNIDPQVGGDLLDELLECVQIIPSGGNPRDFDVETEIQDLKTLYLLRKEALFLHIDFLTQGNSPDLNS